MKPQVFFTLVTLFVNFGCSSVYIVNLNPVDQNEKQEIISKLEHFYRNNNFIHWTEDDKYQVCWWQAQICDPDSDLSDIWIEPGRESKGWLHPGDRGIIAFEYDIENIYKIRLVFQKGGDELEAEKRAGEIAKKMENFLKSELPNISVEVIESRSLDFR